MNDEPRIGQEDRGALSEAWEAICDEVRSAGLRTIHELADVDNPQELAEALRAVIRMALMTVQHRLDFDDPDFPVFFRALDDRYKYAGPDTYITYLNAAVRASGTYRVRGNHRGRELQLGRFWSQDLAYDTEDGDFEIVVSGTEQDGNWQPLGPDVGEGPHEVPTMYPMAQGGFGGRIYRTHLDDDRPTELTIERIDDERPRQPAPLTPTRLVDQLHSARELLGPMSTWWFKRATNVREENTPNVVSAPSHRPPGVPGYAPPEGSPLNYGVCCFELEPDQALLITSELPEAQYWSFQLHTAWWESPDNQHRQTSISDAHAYVDNDGLFRCVLSHADPGTPNWLDVGGSRRGFLFYRWLRPTTPMPTPVATLTTLAEVQTLLPRDHPVLDRSGRDEQLSRRRRWYARRFQS